VLGRWRLQRQQRRRPDASVEVHGEPNTDTHPYPNAYAYPMHGEMYPDAQTSPYPRSAPIRKFVKNHLL